MSNVKQKVEDSLAMIKSSRKWQFFGVCALLCVAFLFFSDNDGRKRRKRAKPQVAVGDFGQGEAYGDLMEAFRDRVESVERGEREIKESINRLETNLEKNEERTATILRKMLEKMDSMSSGDGGTAAVNGYDGNPVPLPPGPGVPGGIDPVTGLPLAGDQVMAQNGAVVDPVTGELIDPVTGMPVANAGMTNAAGVAGVSGVNGEGNFDVIALDDPNAGGLEPLWDEPQTPLLTPSPPDAEKEAFIGAGDSVRVQLLAGVNAPTDGTPYPVIFKLTGDVVGPDGTALPLGEARVIAAAQGSLTDQRALFRLTSLSMRFPNGKRKVVGIDGWIVGEDGLRGMQGVLIDPISEAMLGSAIAAGVAGVGEGISQANTETFRDISGNSTSIVTGDTLEYGGGQALGAAGRTYADFIRRRANQLEPVVQVFSGREATAVFARSVTIPGLWTELNEDASGTDWGPMF